MEAINKSNKVRSAYWDNFKGILIFLVVFAHILYDITLLDSISIIVKTIYVFHMPAFIFTTGFLSKSEHSQNGKSLMKLLIAYFIFNTVMMVYQYCANGIQFQLLSPYNSYWYLIAVIVWRFAVGKIKNHKAVFVASIVAAVLIGFFNDVTNVLAISRIISFFPFFLAGYFLSDNRIKSFIKQRKATHYIKGASLTSISVFLAYLVTIKYNLTTDRMMMYPYTIPVDVLSRIIIFAISSLFILGMIMIIPDKRIPLLTKAGKNSLSIFLIHRIPTLVLSSEFASKSQLFVLIASVLSTAVIVFICSLDVVGKFVDKIITLFSDTICGLKKSIIIKIVSIITVVAITFVPAFTLFKDYFNEINEIETISDTSDSIFAQLDESSAVDFNNDMRVLFVGDLILLEDQVKRGYNGTGYNFDEMFEYTKKYISSADISIGIFEGPMAGEDVGYSTSNYDDGKPFA